MRPVGSPHHGPASVDNVLCLCPNDHVLFDRGVIALDAAWNVIDVRSQTGARDSFGARTDTRSAPSMPPTTALCFRSAYVLSQRVPGRGLTVRDRSSERVCEPLSLRTDSAR
jgi:hypothetical protein